MQRLALVFGSGVACAAFALASVAGPGSHSISGYTKKDGTYVAPSHATNPDKTKVNNWSSKGNVNPYTGKPGTKDPYKPTPPPK
jgi:hypothetical protein